MRSTIQRLARDPLKWYHVYGTGRGTQVETMARSHRIALDVPKSMGGQDAHAQPVEHLLAALIGCEHNTALYVARKMKLKLNEVSDTHGKFMLIIAPLFERGHVRVHVLR